MGKKKKSSDRGRIARRMRQMLDVPLEGITSLSTVQIVGDREVSVTGCRSVLDYTTERILLRVTSGHVMIQGECLEMESLLSDRITVCGRIHTVRTKMPQEGEIC